MYICSCPKSAHSSPIYVRREGNYTPTAQGTRARTTRMKKKKKTLDEIRRPPNAELYHATASGKRMPFCFEHKPHVTLGSNPRRSILPIVPKSAATKTQCGSRGGGGVRSRHPMRRWSPGGRLWGAAHASNLLALVEKLKASHLSRVSYKPRYETGGGAG